MADIEASPSSNIAAARKRTIESAMTALESPDSLASAQKHLENLTKLETLSGLARRRDNIHGAFILVIVLVAVGLAIGVKLTKVTVSALVSARELMVTTSSILVRTPASYRNAKVIVSGDTGVDAVARKELAEIKPSLLITETRQTTEILRAVLRQESNCYSLVVKEGVLVVGLSVSKSDATLSAPQLILRGSASNSANLTICGDVEQSLSLAATVTEMTVEQRLNHGVLETVVLPSVLSGELDIGGRRLQLSPLDVLFLRISHDKELAKVSPTIVDFTSKGVSVRLSGSVSELQIGAVNDRRDRMPSLLESLSRDSPIGIVYSTVIAAFAFLWGLRKVLVT